MLPHGVAMEPPGQDHSTVILILLEQKDAVLHDAPFLLPCDVPLLLVAGDNGTCTALDILLQGDSPEWGHRCTSPGSQPTAWMTGLRIQLMALGSAAKPLKGLL